MRSRSKCGMTEFAGANFPKTTRASQQLWGDHRPWLVLFVLLLVVHAFSTQARSDDTNSAEVPTLQPGDTWTFSWREKESFLMGPQLAGRTFEGEYTQTMVSRTTFQGQSAYLLKRHDGTYDVFTTDLWELGGLGENGSPTVKFTLRASPQFPLYVGREFSKEWDNPAGRYRGSFNYHVVRIEEIETPAGNFTAFRVEETGRGTSYDGTPFTERGYSYYAPTAKRYVRQNIMSSTGYELYVHLVRYSVRP